MNHAMATMPNSELGGLSLSELKFGTRDFKFFQLPEPLIPRDNYGDLVRQLDNNLATVRSITANFRQSLRESRQALTPPTKTNSYQSGDLVLFNPRSLHTFRSSKVARKLLGPYKMLRQLKNYITCEHCIRNTIQTFHSNRVMPFIGAQKAASTLGLLDRNECIVESIVAHTGTPSRLTSLKFLVHCAGHPTDEDSWEPWTSLRTNALLHHYLKNHNLSYIIRQVYRT